MSSTNPLAFTVLQLTSDGLLIENLISIQLLKGSNYHCENDIFSAEILQYHICLL